MWNYLCSFKRERQTDKTAERSEEHTSELQSHWYISYAVFCLKKKKQEEDEQKYEKKEEEKR